MPRQGLAGTNAVRYILLCHGDGETHSSSFHNTSYPPGAVYFPSFLERYRFGSHLSIAEKLRVPARSFFRTLTPDRPNHRACFSCNVWVLRLFSFSLGPRAFIPYRLVHVHDPNAPDFFSNSSGIDESDTENRVFVSAVEGESPEAKPTYIKSRRFRPSQDDRSRRGCRQTDWKGNVNSRCIFMYSAAHKLCLSQGKKAVVAADHGTERNIFVLKYFCEEQENAVRRRERGSDIVQGLSCTYGEP
ncbi:hypothetical protein GGS21DRAFT_435550 [Xylaria nigripes]|nr:hypothetical protein GGS21DRAFT_435550 [Xylaria nigripes]